MLLDPKAGVLVQGITGREASRMVEDSLAYGSNIVAGVTPGKGGQHVHGIPVYDTVAAAVKKHGATISVISVPPPTVLDATLESFDAGMQLCLIMTERVPQLDTSKLLVVARRVGCTVIGPNSLGLIRPGIAKLGTIGGRVDNVRRSFMPGRVAVLSRQRWDDQRDLQLPNEPRSWAECRYRCGWRYYCRFQFHGIGRSSRRRSRHRCCGHLRRAGVGLQRNNSQHDSSRSHLVFG